MRRQTDLQTKMRWRMSCLAGMLAVLMLVVSACGGGSTSSPQATQKPYLPPLPPISGLPVAALQGELTGLLSPDQTLQLTIGLSMDRQGLAQAAQNIYDSSSPNYGHYLTPQQIATQFGAPNAAIQKVSNWLTGLGFQIVSTSPLHTSLIVQANVLQIARAFQVALQVRTLNGRVFFGPSNAPTLPSDIAPLITSITGLSDFARILHTPPHFTSNASASAPTTGQQPDVGDCTLYGVLGSVTRDQLAHAYTLDQLYKKGFRGQGMKIGVIELGDPYSRNDVANYAVCNGVQLHLRNIAVDGSLAPGTGAGEAALDIEMIAGLAPDAEILDYQTPNPDEKGFLDALNQVAADDQVQVLSISYGAGEDQFEPSYLAQLDDTLEVLAVEGISVFVASGDCAAYVDGVFGQLQVSFPASAPWAIGVGGTSFQGNKEIAWSASPPDRSQCQNTWGTGGGVSQVKAFARPIWQTGLNVQNKSSNGNRQVPDVAAAADNISIYYMGFWLGVGGTSAAAPIWAAGTVVVDQALQKQGKTLIGGVPAIYMLANSAGKYHPYHDITQGTNFGYNAGPGWDYTTGWGSPSFIDIAHILGGA
jgi:kumamolisin